MTVFSQACDFHQADAKLPLTIELIHKAIRNKSKMNADHKQYTQIICYQRISYHFAINSPTNSPSV